MKINNPNTSIFSIALGLDSPWYAEDVQLLDNNESSTTEIHLYLNFTRSHEFVLPDGHSVKG